MELPNLDWAGDNKAVVIGGGLFVVAFIAIARMSQRNDQSSPVQQATIVPPEGVTWRDIIGERNEGVIGVVGPGEPVPGDSAYDIARKQGFTGTLQEWLDSLKGAPGAPGSPGTPGTDTTVVVNADWLKIRYGSREGYVHASYVSGNKVNTPGSCLRFRSAPDYAASVYDCIPHGTALTVLGSQAGTTPSSVTPPTNTVSNVSGTTVTKDGYTWVKLSYGGKTGYAANKWLCGNRVCGTGTDGLRLRSAPGLNAPIIANMPEGATVNLASAGAAAAGHSIEGVTNPGGRTFAFNPVPAPLRHRGDITVRQGDTLKSLSARAYGTSSWWRYLWDMNPDKGQPQIGEKWRT